MPFEQCALSDLVNVGTVCLHTEQIGHDVPVAHAELGLARGGEHDIAVWQVQRVDIDDARLAGNLPEPRPIGLDFVKVVVVIDVFTEGKNDFFAVEMDIGIANTALPLSPSIT